ncbi:hypothetical protein PybrP1_006093, partial [[Pythium] brassicae (nom. inval.)]
MYDELRSVALEHQQRMQTPQENRRRKLLGGRMKKALKCVDTVERLLHVGLPALCDGRVRSVVLIFGASVFSPREVYVIDFARGEPAPSRVVQTPLSKDKVARLCAQKLVRALILAGSERVHSDLAVTALHIAVLAEKRASGIPGFVPKQSFRLRLPRSRRGVSRTYRICLVGGAEPAEPSSPAVVASERHLPPPSPPVSSTDSNERGDSNGGQAHKSEPWFLGNRQALDPDWIWYTSDRSILGFS